MALHHKRHEELPRTTAEFLDRICREQGLKTDKELAKVLHTGPAAICNYRSKRSLPDEVMACRIAKEIGMDRGYVLACIAAERTSDSMLKETWLDMAKKLELLSVAALAVALGVSASEPFELLPAAFAASQLIHYTNLMGVALAIWALSRDGWRFRLPTYLQRP